MVQKNFPTDLEIKCWVTLSHECNNIYLFICSCSKRHKSNILSIHTLHTRMKALQMMTVFDHLWNGKEAQTSSLISKAFRSSKKSSVYTSGS